MTISPACRGLIRLSSIKGLGLRTFYHLHREFGSVERILMTEFEHLKGAGVKVAICRAITQLNEGSQSFSPELERISEWIEGANHFVCCIEDDLYPSCLREIYCPPPIIYMKGEPGALNYPSIAMVGSRNASVAGIQHAFEFARDLAQLDYCVVSGLALGVDAASHKGALHAGGKTCAVLGTGLDVIYPKKHSKLADEICEKGLILSEMGLGSLPRPANFPRRNRIISGLSKGVLVVEASLKSGSLITAGYAVEQNREVYAIPGPIDSPVSAGCHALIKQGAQLVESAEDILPEGLFCLGEQNELPLENTDNKLSCTKLSDEEAQVVERLDYQSTSFDTLLIITGLEVSQLTKVLMSLELKGELCTVPGGYQRVKTINSPA